MPGAAEVESFLSLFDAPTIAAARQLVESRRTRILKHGAENFLAEISFEDEIIQATFRKHKQIWSGTTDATGNQHKIALCAAMLEAEMTHGQFGGTEPQLSLTEIVEDKLSRKLAATEEQYLAKVEKRHERYLALGEIHDHDLVRLNSRWPIQSYEPLKLWPKPPKDVLEFWNYLAAALVDRKLTYPAFLESVTDLAGTNAKLDAWKQAEDLPRWAELIREFSQREEITLTQAELRLIITPAEARFQVNDPEQHKWRLITEEELDLILAQDRLNALRLPLPSRLLIESAARWIPRLLQPIIRLEEHDAARWLGSLLIQEELNSHLVTLDEIPLRHSPTTLVWSAEEVPAEGPRAATIILHLRTSEDSEPQKPLRYLPAAQPLYLSADTLYRGPANFEESTQAQTSIEIPMAALASEEGVQFLNKLGVDLPPNLAKKVTRETFNVRLIAKCLPKAEQGSTEHASISVEATSSNGLLTQRLRGRRWEMQEQLRAPDDTIPCYDRNSLDIALPLVESIKGTYDLELDAFRVRVTKTFPQQFETWARSLPESVTLQTDDRLQSILEDPLTAKVRLEVNETGMDWFDLRLVFDIEGLELKPAEIRRLIAARGGYVRLADGTWRSVKLELSEEQQEAFAALGIDLNDLSDEAHPIHARQLALQQRKDLLPPELWENVKERLNALDLQTKPDVPAQLNATLRPYQIEGFQFLVYLAINRFGGVLADDMGLGKTMQSITWMLWLRNHAIAEGRPLSPILVVCPKSVLDVWAIEIAKAAPVLRVQVLREKDTLNIEETKANVDVLVLNYAQLRACIDDLARVSWLAAILDEGQQIKNPDSKVAKAARQLQAQNRLVLTGTPLENRLLDLWSLMTFATPGALGDRAYFQKHFDRRKDDRAAERLSARLRPFILRRTKSQVARDLPPRSEESMLCELSGIQERLYREQLANAQHMILTATGADALSKRRFAILQAITRLRQICCHPALVQPDAIHEESAKLNALMELLDQLHDEGHKVLVFSQFVTMLKIIRDKLVQLGRPHHWLTGATQNRNEVVQDFQNTTDASVFLLSLKAGGSGLNLTAASYVVLYDPWWNPAVENQAIDRAHRIGQTQPVMAYRLLAKNTIEEKIQRLQQQKQFMSQDVLGSESFSRSLDRADLEYLFGIGDPQEEEDNE